MKTNLFLCSFASSDLNLSVERFVAQAKKLNIYSGIKVFRTKDLSDELNNRINRLIKEKGRYLYGYEIWKQKIISEYLKNIPDNAILQYSDIGCHLNDSGIKRLNDYVSITEKNNMLVFAYEDPPENMKVNDYNFQVNKEYNYTKGDVFKYFNVNPESEIYNSPQIWAGAFFMKKCDFVLNILDTWQKACNHIELLDESESIFANHPEFIGMRGSQGVFSIICKLNNVSRLSASECEWAEGKDGSGRKWSHLKHYPILAKRDLKYGLIKRFFNRQKKNINRFLKKLK